MDRGMTENGEDREDNSDGSEIDGDELINAIKEGTANLKRPENKKVKLNANKVGRPKEGIDKLTKYKSSGWQTGLTAKQWIENCEEHMLDKQMPLLAMPDFDPDKMNFYGEVGVTGHKAAVAC
eukprot:7385229-Prymnesium_polylepis.1